MESESKVVRREHYCSGLSGILNWAVLEGLRAWSEPRVHGGLTHVDACGIHVLERNAWQIKTHNVNVDGRGLTMTPWKRSIFVLFILSWIDVSEEGCDDYFTNMDERNQRQGPVGYVNLPDKNASIRCTLQINSPEHSHFKAFLRDCYDAERENTPNNTMCHQYTVQNISFHHFMCLMASDLEVPYIDCYPGDLCLSLSSATRSIPTTTPTTPPTTIPERTSTAPPPTPTPTTTVPERTSTAPPPTPTVNTANSSAMKDTSVKPEKIHDIDKQTVSLLSISVAVNVVLLLLVIYLWMHQRRKELVVEFLKESTSPQSGLTTEEPNSTILQNHELSYLIHENENEHEKDPVCNSTDTHSPLNGNDCAVNKMLP